MSIARRAWEFLAGPKSSAKLATFCSMRSSRLCASVLVLGISVATTEYFACKWLWWRVPCMRYMHASHVAEDGALVMFDRSCYFTLLTPIAFVLVSFGFMGLVALWCVCSLRTWNRAGEARK